MTPRPRLSIVSPEPDQLRTLLCTLAFCAEAAERLKDNAADDRLKPWARDRLLRMSVALAASVEDIQANIKKGTAQ